MNVKMKRKKNNHNNNNVGVVVSTVYYSLRVRFLYIFIQTSSGRTVFCKAVMWRRLVDNSIVAVHVVGTLYTRVCMKNKRIYLICKYYTRSRNGIGITTFVRMPITYTLAHVTRSHPVRISKRVRSTGIYFDNGNRWWGRDPLIPLQQLHELHKLPPMFNDTALITGKEQ